MKDNVNNTEVKKDIDVQTEKACGCCCEDSCCEDSQENILMKEIEEKTNQCDELKNILQRTAAEFDNYKKRTVREKEALYTEAFADAVTSFLPIIDNLDRALQASSKEGDLKSLKDGVEMIFKQVTEIINKLGVEEIKSSGEKFDPEFHNAVMHVEDENFGENEVVEELQKGYKIKEKVIRHSMVKVAN